jgi:hypothetical protein
MSEATMPAGLGLTVGVIPRYLRDTDQSASASRSGERDPAATDRAHDNESEHDRATISELALATTAMRQRIGEATVNRPSHRRPIAAALVVVGLLAIVGVAFPRALAFVAPNFSQTQ